MEKTKKEQTNKFSLRNADTSSTNSYTKANLLSIHPSFSAEWTKSTKKNNQINSICAIPTQVIQNHTPKPTYPLLFHDLVKNGWRA